MVGRRFGNAVRRNRIKRQIREIFRLNKHQFPYTMDIVAIPLSTGEAPSTGILREEFLRLIGVAGDEGKSR